VPVGELVAAADADQEGRSAGEEHGIAGDPEGNLGQVDQSSREAEEVRNLGSQEQGQSLQEEGEESRDHTEGVGSSQRTGGAEDGQEEGRVIRRGSGVVPGTGQVLRSSADSTRESATALNVVVFQVICGTISSIRRKATEISTWLCAFSTGL
jgi:hypothetical protein